MLLFSSQNLASHPALASSLTEAAIAVELLLGSLTAASTLAEPNSALESSVGVLLATGVLTESSAAADSATKTVSASTAISESISNTDATISTTTASVVQTDNASASELTAITFTATATEPGSTTDLIVGTTIGSVSQLESGAATDTSLIAAFVSAISEVGLANDAESATAVLSQVTNESAVAATQQGIGPIAVSITEQGSAQDSLQTATQEIALQTENSSSGDTSVSIVSSSAIEPSAAVDATAVGPISCNVTETTVLIDSTAVSVSVGITETSTLSSIEQQAAVFTSSISESATNIDSSQQTPMLNTLALEPTIGADGSSLVVVNAATASEVQSATDQLFGITSQDSSVSESTVADAVEVDIVVDIATTQESASAVDELQANTAMQQVVAEQVLAADATNRLTTTICEMEDDIVLADGMTVSATVLQDEIASSSETVTSSLTTNGEAYEISSADDIELGSLFAFLGVEAIEVVSANENIIGDVIRDTNVSEQLSSTDLPYAQMFADVIQYEAEPLAETVIGSSSSLAVTDETALISEMSDYTLEYLTTHVSQGDTADAQDSWSSNLIAPPVIERHFARHASKLPRALVRRLHEIGEEDRISVSLAYKGKQWAINYNELKERGSVSAKFKTVNPRLVSVNAQINTNQPAVVARFKEN